MTDRLSVRRLDQETSTRLQDAIREGDIATLEHFSSDARAWLCKTIFLGGSLFGLAVMDGKRPVVEALLRLGCDPNEPIWRTSDDFYTLDYGLYVESPLSHAVGSWHRGRPDIENTRLLLTHGALVDGHPTARSSPLSWAAACGNLPAAKLLVEAGADLNWEGWRGGPPLDEAISWRVTGSGSEKVADYLRSVGATETYLEWHNWSDRQLEFIERTLGVVNPRPIEREIGRTSISVYKARFAPRKFQNRLLFTRGLAPFLGAELGVVVSNLWPLNKGGLLEQRFSWPVDLLFHLAAAVIRGAKLEHGSVVNATDKLLQGFSTPVPQWIVGESGALEAARVMGDWAGTVPTLILSPVLTKKRYTPGREAEEQALKRSGWKWERLHLPLPHLTPVGYEYLEQLDKADGGVA